MAEKSAFDVQHIQQAALITDRGLLENLNLPPAAIRYIRKNKKNLQIAATVVAVLALVLAAYSSYREMRREKGTAALAAAMELGDAERKKSLTAVAAEYSGYPSAHWASIELAHGLMKEGKYKEAAEGYVAVRKKVGASSPLSALLTVALAGAYEASGDAAAATNEYKALQKIVGYEEIGATGLARVYEAQGDKKQALAVLEEYKATLEGQPNNPANAGLDEKIDRLKARM